MADEPSVKSLGLISDQFIPVPEHITEKGFTEIARLWRKDAPEDGGERLVALTRGTYDTPQEWHGVIATLARTAATFYGNGVLSPVECEQLGVSMLLGAVNNIVAHSEELTKKFAAEGSIGPQPAAKQQQSSTSLPRLTAKDGDGQGDPRQIPVPQEIIVDPNAVHLLTVWVLPETPKCDDCPDCGIDHEASTYIGVNTAKLGEKDLGKMLGMIASLHSQNVSEDKLKQYFLTSEIIGEFLAYMNKGLPRA